MPKQKVNKFLGYTTKTDKFIRQPGVATEILNCFIHQGDIVNLPSILALNLPDIAEDHVGNHLASGLYADRIHEYIIIVQQVDTNELVIYLQPINSRIGNTFLSETIHLTKDFPLIYLVNRNFPYVNIQQFGRFAYITGDFGVDKLIHSDSELHGLPRKALTPHMIKVIFDENEDGVQSYYLDTIGVEEPFFCKVTNNETSGGPINDDSYELALSIVHPLIDLPRDVLDLKSVTIQGGASSYMDNINSESNIRAINNGAITLNSTGRYITFQIMFHPGFLLPAIMNRFGGITVGLYARKSSESHYDFIGYWDTGGIGTPGPHNTTITYGQVTSADFFTNKYGIRASTMNLKYIEFTVDLNGSSLDVTKEVPIRGTLGPTLGSNNRPRPAFHFAEFKQRLYYQSLAEDDIYNRLEVSRRTPIGIAETGTYGQYIEVEEFVGNSSEAGSGLIEFANNLIIFKENSTYRLTDDIVDYGRLLILFPDIGCTNDNTTKSYITCNGKLYWYFKNKAYSWDGASEPIEISEVIAEDFRTIDTSITISANEDYDLLYFTPKGLGFSYIYNTSNGTWSKSSIGFTNIIKAINGENFGIFRHYMFIISDISNVFYISPQIRELSYGPYNIVWQSSKFDFGEISRDKWWKWFRFSGILDRTSEDSGIVYVYNENDERITGIVRLRDIDDIVRIGRTNKNIMITWVKEPIGSMLPTFRINELEVEATVRGRR